MIFNKIIPANANTEADYVVQYVKLYRSSGLTRKCWCRLIGIKMQQHSAILNNKSKVSRLLVIQAYNASKYMLRCIKNYKRGAV